MRARIPVTRPTGWLVRQVLLLNLERQARLGLSPAERLDGAGDGQVRR
jgi:hypothetical protein